MKSMQEENILEHSAVVAQIAHILAVINNEIYKGSADANRCAAMAIYHDSSEVLTGDLPTPIKYYNTDINNAYGELEDRANDKLLEKLPNELRHRIEDIMKPNKDSIEYQFVKAADKLAAYIKCIEESKFGNKEFSKALKSNKEAVNKIDLQEVKYFVDNFIDSFKLTLDELDI